MKLQHSKFLQQKVEMFEQEITEVLKTTYKLLVVVMVLEERLDMKCM